MLDVITSHLYLTPPADTLYHYTSLPGLLGIVGSGELRASDIRYMNDSAELRHTIDLLSRHVTRRIVAGCDDPALLNQLLEWLSHRIVSGPMLFGASFRANGNLLSQWRGYSVHGKGVSLGFDPGHICACAARQQFQVGKCLYAESAQSELVEQMVDAVERLAREGEPAEGPAEQRWYPVFEQVEGDLLRIAAVLKHPSFEEEQEWRIVSPVIDDCESAPVSFREGSSMLVPYYAFNLMDQDHGRFALDHVFLGPTSNIDLSLKSIDLFLRKHRAEPRRGISYCRIPFRQR